MLSAAATTAAAAFSHEYDASLVVTRPGTTTSPVGGTTESWDSPTTVTTLNGVLYPADAETARQAGVLSLGDARKAFMESFALNPETHRVTTSGSTYRVVVARQYASHTEALLVLTQ